MWSVTSQPCRIIRKESKMKTAIKKETVCLQYNYNLLRHRKLQWQTRHCILNVYICCRHHGLSYVCVCCYNDSVSWQQNTSESGHKTFLQDSELFFCQCGSNMLPYSRYQSWRWPSVVIWYFSGTLDTTYSASTAPGLNILSGVYWKCAHWILTSQLLQCW